MFPGRWSLGFSTLQGCWDDGKRALVMPALRDLIEDGRPVAAHRPWPRRNVSAKAWVAAADGLAAGAGTLLGLWGDGDAVLMALIEDATGDVAVLGLDCPD